MPFRHPPNIGSLDLIGESVILDWLQKLLGFKEIIVLASTCRRFRAILLSKSCPIWSSRETNICIDSSCFGCGRIQISKKLATRLLRDCAISQLRMHIPVTFLEICISELICNDPSLKSLHLRLRGDHCHSCVFHGCISSLESLCIYGGAGCSKATESLLQSVGKSLITLKLQETSPMGIFAMMGGATSVCPNLKVLHIDGAQDESELGAYNSKQLEELRLVDSGIKLGKVPLSLPSLRSLSLIDTTSKADSPLYVTLEDISALVYALPTSLAELEICINSTLANELLFLVGNRFSLLESLHIHFIDGLEPAPDLTYDAIMHLQRGCKYISSIFLTDGLVGFAPRAFTAFGKFEHLRSIDVLYDEHAVGNLDSVLQESPSLESIRFFESADYIVNNEDQDDASNGGRGDDRIGAWCTMEEDLRIFQQKYPAVQIQLHDWWWGT